MASNTAALDIRREMVLRAPRDKVWAALTTREGWSSWFGRGIEGEFREGETMVMDFGSDGKCWAVVVERVERSVFAYRWHPGEDCVMDKYPLEQMTTVRFELSDVPAGTRLVLTETGFENVPEERRANAARLNNSGWDWELEELQAFIERGEKHSKSKSSQPL